MKHVVQVATTREQTQHRYVIANLAPVVKALEGQPGDIFGISRSSKGTYAIEKNTVEINAIHEFFFPAKSGSRPSSASGASGAPATATTTKKRAPSKKRPTSATTTTTATEEYYEEDVYPSEEPLLSTKRRRIGGSSSGLTRRLPKTGTATTSQQTFNQTERLMGPLTRPKYSPMLLLPGEVPLGIETFFGEGKYANATPSETSAPAPPLSIAAAPVAAECTAQPPARYRHAVARAREGMKKKAMAKGGKPLVLRAIQAVELFERICLGDVVVKDDGITKITAADRREACIEYDTVLRMIYPELILDAHVLDVKILEDMEGTDELQLLRCMERRFIIWKQTEGTPLQPLQYNSGPLQQQRQQQQPGPQQQRPSSRTEGIMSTLGFSLQWAKNRISHRSSSAADVNQQSTANGGADNNNNQKHHGSSLPRWGDGLKHIWEVFSSRVGDKTYGGVDLRTTDANVSCALNDTIWWNGQLVRRPVSSHHPVLSIISDALAGKRDGNPRLYLTDGSMPDYESQNYPRAAPGMPCHVDALTNAMLPHAVQSSRSTNLFHFLKNESTGTGTFTLFGGVGPGANLTAFHFETKRRRSYNCATGDYIFQPLAAAGHTRAMMRVHAAVAGKHTRHGQLLPLECYLEEGITMVTHLRTEAEPSLCELCEQSMHAFITFDDGTSSSSATDTTTAAPAPAPAPASATFNTTTTAPAPAPITIRNYGNNKSGSVAISSLLFPPAPLNNNTEANNNNNNNTVAEKNIAASSSMMPLKVSCNDFDLIWDIDATYYMERVSNAYQSVNILPEEAPPPDGADTWVQSSYLTAEPRTLRDLKSSVSTEEGGGGGTTTTTIRPWACEVTSAARKEIQSPGWKADLRGRKKENEDFELDSGMDVIVVRTAEKLLDVLLKKVTADVAQPWVGEVPSMEDAREALKRVIPVLHDMITRALSENGTEGEHFFFLNSHTATTSAGVANFLESMKNSDKWRDACHFSREYLQDLLQKISRDSGLVQNSSMTAAVISSPSSGVGHVPPRILFSEDIEQLGDLTAGVLRNLWMHRLVEERKAILAQPLDFQAVAVARRQRHAAEVAFDIACCQLIKRNARAWGMVSHNNELETGY